MRAIVLVLLMAMVAGAEHQYVWLEFEGVCGGAEVGAGVVPAGGRRRGAGFEHLGFIHPYLVTVAADPGDAGTLYAATGNGVIRMTAEGGVSGGFSPIGGTRSLRTWRWRRAWRGARRGCMRRRRMGSLPPMTGGRREASVGLRRRSCADARGGPDGGGGVDCGG